MPTIQDLQLPDGGTQSKHTFIAEQLLAVIDALGYENTLIWAKSDNFINQVKLVSVATLQCSYDNCSDAMKPFVSAA